MLRFRAVASFLVLGALLATTPGLAFGQDENRGEIRIDVRPGTEIRSSQLGELLARSITVGLPIPPLNSTLRVEMISREEGVVATSVWEPVETAETTARGRAYEGSIWIYEPDRMTEAFAPAFGDGRNVTFGRTIDRPGGGIPRECADATHALRIALLGSDDRRMAAVAVCLSVVG